MCHAGFGWNIVHILWLWCTAACRVWVAVSIQAWMNVLLVVIWKQHVWKSLGWDVKSMTVFWPLRDQRCLDIFFKYFTVNEGVAPLTSWYLSLAPECACFSLSSTFGALLLLPHGCCHRLILVFLNSQASHLFWFCFSSCCPYLPPFFSRLLFLSLCWGCLFSLSVGLHLTTTSVVERSSVLLC